MAVLAVSVVDALVVIGLGAAGFAVVALVCVAVLALLHLVLPATDSGADEIDRLHPTDDADPPPGEAEPLDTEVNA
jgi:hypothetical protein